MWLTNIPIAHRGLHTGDSLVPENSIKSFEKALEKGYAIELDVHITKDDKIIVHHDYSLLRMTGFEGFIKETTWDSIEKLNLLETEEKVPSFEDVLELISGKVPILIEIKNEGSPGRLEEKLIQILKDYNGDFAVQSFNPFVVKYFKDNAPGIMRGQLSGDFKGENLAGYKKFLLRNLLFNFITLPHFVAYEVDKMPGNIKKRLKRANIPILIWTVKSIDDYKKLRKDFDNVIFEGFEPE